MCKRIKRFLNCIELGNELTTEIIATLVQKQDLAEVFRHHLEIAINQLLQTELAAFLGYERYSYAGINTGNNRNGSYECSFDTKYGQLHLKHSAGLQWYFPRPHLASLRSAQ